MSTNNSTIQEFLSEFKKTLHVAAKADRLKEGDWKGLLAIASDLGYSFTKEELIKGLPDNFFHGSGQNKDVGWRRDFELEDSSNFYIAETTWNTCEGLPLLKGQMQKDCYDIVVSALEKHGLEITDGSIHHDQVKLSIKVPMQTYFGQLVATLKSETSIAIKAMYPELDKELNKMPVWST